MKSGIDYFPLDVSLDDKFELIEAEFGLTGFAVIVKLLQRIYGRFGYYCEWTNEVVLLFAKKIGKSEGVVSEIVSAAIRRGVFDEALYKKYQILTSKGIQKRYFEAASRRKNVEVESVYLLIPAAQIYKNVYIKGENVDINAENADMFQQSRVEESKGKDSRVNKSKVEDIQAASSFCNPDNEKGAQRLTFNELVSLGRLHPLYFTIAATEARMQIINSRQTIEGYLEENGLLEVCD